MQKVIVITGPTAVGKTALSIDIAHEINGEVISADSRQVYRGLDIGSSKITAEEMQGVPHYLLDVADPRTTFAASDFVRLGRKALEEIERHERTPLIVGGTGFYIDALLGRATPAPVSPNNELREELTKLTTEELAQKLKDLDAKYAEKVDAKNKRRLVRAIEIIDTLGYVPRPTIENLYDILWVGLTLPFSELREKIRARIEIRLAMGMLDEARNLYKEGVPYERMEALGLEYRLMAQHLQGKMTEERLKVLIENESIAYAKRQMTWFKKNKSMHWFTPSNVEGFVPEEQEKIMKLVNDFLQK